MKTPLALALCAMVFMFACTEDSTNISYDSQSYTLQLVIEETENAHEEFFVLQSEDYQFLNLTPAVSQQIQKIASPGASLDIYADDVQEFIKESNFDISQVKVSKELEASNRNGTRRVLAILINTETHECLSSIAEVEDMMFNPNISSKSLESFFSLQTKGQMHFSGDVIELDIDPTYVSLSMLMSLCKEPALELGYDYNDYDHISFISDKTRNYLGVGLLGGKFTHIDNSRSSRALAHEIGHNLKLHHSTKLNSDGSISEYGDHSCTMGGRYRELNALHILNNGWIRNNNVSNIKKPAKVLDLYPLEYDLSFSGKKQIIQIKSDDRSNTLTVSMRTNYNVFDQNLSQDYSNKLCIHKTHSYYKTLLMETLDVGESYYSEATGKTIVYQQFNAHDGSAVVEIY